jgi:hypothetical protein
VVEVVGLAEVELVAAVVVVEPVPVVAVQKSQLVLAGLPLASFEERVP